MATLALSVAGQVVGGAVGGPIGATIGRALGAMAGSAVDAALFAEKPEPAPGADIRLTGSAEGGAIPRLYGWGRLGGNIIWATELEELAAETSGAKGTSEAEPREIVASFAVGFCMGEVARLGRIWADGQVLETAGLNLRFYTGSETQDVDSLIEARQDPDAAPAYRGLCYLVFERLPLGLFGNRIPAISAELCRPVGELEQQIRSVTLIPGATEFGYDPVPRVRLVGPGAAAAENAHLSALESDWTLSLDELQALCPNLGHVSLVTAWFGDDLRCGHCSIRPKVEAASRSVKGTTWSVAGLSRGAAQVVSQHGGGPAYGGTPSDAALKAAIADLRARGLAVTLYPMILMDIPEANAMGQPAYPWRGRIAGDADNIGGFVGSAGDWGFRRFVRHHAALAAQTGCDALVLGSELVGLTTLQDAVGGFPFVDALVGLAAEARALAPEVKLTYAADWSEYHGYQPPEAPGDKLFHLDPLWADANIDAVGIDNYLPLADWRDGEDHPDAALWDGPHQLAYLSANIAGGEGFDWFYASAADRLSATRTAIVDGAHGEDWIWRVKDIAGWWSHAHHDRVEGVRASLPTAWVPGMKPVWFTELGCGAVDKGANQPNAFPDAKSSEDTRPYFSAGTPDALAQRQFLRAHLAHWAGPENPVSEVYAGPMVDPGRISLWTWDARPFPAFPGDAATWADAENHATGHWLNGRLGGAASDELLAAIAADFGVPLAAADAAAPLIEGLTVERLGPARDAMAGPLGVTGLAPANSPGGLVFGAAPRRDAVSVAADDLVADDAPRLARRRPDPAEQLAQLMLSYAARDRDYLTATATALRLSGAGQASESAGMVLDGAGARLATERLLLARAAGETLDLSLPPSWLALEPGDVLALPGEGGGPFVVSEIRDGLARKLSLNPLPPPGPVTTSGDAPRGPQAPASAAAPLLLAAQVPPDPATSDRTRLLLAAYATPWPGSVDVTNSATGTRLARLTRAAAMGELLTPLAAGPIHLWDGRAVEIRLYGGHVADSDDLAALAGGNRLLVVTDAGGWEAIGFAGAELLAPGHYRLRRLLRGLDGTDPAMGPAAPGNRVLVLDDAVATVEVDPEWLGAPLELRGFAGRHDATGTGFAAALDTAPLLPLPPAHLRCARAPDGAIAVTWQRRSRADAGGWAAAEVPLEVTPEAYLVSIFDGAELVRSREVSTSAASYSAAEQLADFGGPASGFDVSVAQLSPVYGPGHAARVTCNV
ncbi:baseplate multidomain protein megatron [Devosia sp.]|uniref:baseplate multidomain protein megatron n=1 Tax=Devosia sp. TaxID=1871048 RepID=UPI003A951FBA